MFSEEFETLYLFFSSTKKGEKFKKPSTLVEKVLIIFVDLKQKYTSGDAVL